MHFLQIVDDRKEKNVLREKCMESVKRFVTEKDTYTVKEVTYSDNSIAMINEMDKIRFSIAKEHNDLLYVDTDCFLAALPTEEIKKSKRIIIGQIIIENDLVPNMFLFYVNGQKEFFLKNYAKLIEPHDSFSLSPEQLRLFADHWTSYEPFSYCYYSLLNLEININKQFNLLSNRLIEAEKEVNSYKSSIQQMATTAELYNKLREKQGK